MTAIIPNIHPDPDRLDRSLRAAGNHPVPFLGDLIDAHDHQDHVDDLAVLHKARGLIESGRATGILGNHEMNAIRFHRFSPDGKALREHSRENTAQHRSFIAAFGTATPEALDWTGWMLAALPLWQDAGGLRLVHAFWSDALIDTVRACRPDGYLKPEDIPEIAARQTPFAQAVDRMLTGPEIALPEGHGFFDRKGKERHNLRMRVWRRPTDWADAALSAPAGLPLPEGYPAGLDSLLYPQDAPPVLVGHYKMTGSPAFDAPRGGLIDYPEAPCVSLWDGEADLSAANLHRV